MIQSGVLKDCRSPMVPSPVLRGPAPLRRTAGNFIQRAPAFVGRRLRLVDRPANVCQLADEIVELRFDLRPDPRASLRQIQPSPDSAGGGTRQGRQQYTRSFFHIDLLSLIARTHTRTPAITTHVSKGVPRDRCVFLAGRLSEYRPQITMSVRR